MLHLYLRLPPLERCWSLTLWLLCCAVLWPADQAAFVFLSKNYSMSHTFMSTSREFRDGKSNLLSMLGPVDVVHDPGFMH